MAGLERSLVEIAVESGRVEGVFEVDNFELGEQTQGAIQNGLANSSKGQHIHFITNMGLIFW